MLRRATTWILTAAIAFCAGNGVPVSRLRVIRVEVSIAWFDEDQEKRHTRRRTMRSRESIVQPLALRARSFVIRILPYILYNRPPPAFSLA